MFKKKNIPNMLTILRIILVPLFVVLIYFPYEAIIDIKPQIQLALDSFRRVLEVDSVIDVSRLRKSGGKVKRVFNDYEKWPCYYHLDMLAHTNSWKTEVMPDGASKS